MRQTALLSFQHQNLLEFLNGTEHVMHFELCQLDVLGNRDEGMGSAVYLINPMLVLSIVFRVNFGAPVSCLFTHFFFGTQFVANVYS